jgi:hypothetical protein
VSSSSLPPASGPTESPSLTAVLDELTRLRMRVATGDRVALLDSIKKIDRDLRAIEHSIRFQQAVAATP